MITSVTNVLWLEFFFCGKRCHMKPKSHVQLFLSLDMTKLARVFPKM